MYKSSPFDDIEPAPKGDAECREDDQGGERVPERPAKKEKQDIRGHERQSRQGEGGVEGMLERCDNRLPGARAFRDEKIGKRDKIHDDGDENNQGESVGRRRKQILPGGCDDRTEREDEWDEGEEEDEQGGGKRPVDFPEAERLAQGEMPQERAEEGEAQRGDEEEEQDVHGLHPLKRPRRSDGAGRNCAQRGSEPQEEEARDLEEDNKKDDLENRQTQGRLPVLAEELQRVHGISARQFRTLKIFTQSWLPGGTTVTGASSLTSG